MGGTTDSTVEDNIFRSWEQEEDIKTLKHQIIDIMKNWD